LGAPSEPRSQSSCALRANNKNLFVLDYSVLFPAREITRIRLFDSRFTNATVPRAGAPKDAPKMSNSDRVWYIRVDPAIRQVVADLAAAEERRPSEMVRRILAEALRDKGLLPRPTAKPIASRTEAAA
jgi:hypothetical protein